jgi:hypothetical protein
MALPHEGGVLFVGGLGLIKMYITNFRKNLKEG